MSIDVNQRIEMLVGGESRTQRMMRWMLEHRETLDAPATKGKLLFDLGRGQHGSAEVAVQLVPAPERLR